jgi:hypothetical protein
MNRKVKPLFFVMLLLSLNACSILQTKFSPDKPKPPSDGQVTPQVPQLGMAWKLYPDPREHLVREGEEEIVFELTPNTKEDFILHFGDRNSEPVSVFASDISCLPNGGKCEPVFRSHVYKTGGAYKPYVIYDDGGKPFLENAKVEKIPIVSHNARTDGEHKEKALEDMLEKLVLEFQRLQGDRQVKLKKLAVVILKDANFEHPKPSEEEEKEAKLNRMTVKCVKGK